MFYNIIAAIQWGILFFIEQILCHKHRVAALSFIRFYIQLNFIFLSPARATIIQYFIFESKFP